MRIIIPCWIGPSDEALIALAQCSVSGPRFRLSSHALPVEAFNWHFLEGNGPCPGQPEMAYMILQLPQNYDHWKKHASLL